MLRVLDLFSGIGGFSLGLERTGGFKTVAFCEIDPFCRKVLAKHWPSVPCYHDVRELTSERLACDGIAPDCIVGGFPCQDISHAGSGLGIEGERSGLWREYARLIGDIRPSLVVVENVRALLGRGLATVLGDLAAFGYDAEWETISACALGAPHVRQRLFLVAYPNGQHGRAWLRNTTPQPIRAVQSFYDLESARADFRARMANPSALYGGADGLPDCMDRNRAIGNSIFPQIPEMIGRAILAAEPRKAA
jgi:DNA (cytosine-5)-methyltransferase 1